MLQHAVRAGCSEADRLRVQHESEELASRSAGLTSAMAAHQQSLVEINDHIVTAQNELNELRKKQRDLAEECQKIADAIVAATALQRFLIQHTTLDDLLWTKFEALLQIKRTMPALFSTSQDWITPDLRARVRAFLEQIARGGDRPRPGTAA